MKKAFLMIAAAMLVLASCEKPSPVTPPEPDPDPIPAAGFGIYVNEDGSIIVEGDDGVERVNSLAKAVASYADSLVTTSESQTEVQCNNVFILPRGSQYYFDAQFTIKTNVTFKAAAGKGEQPRLCRLMDLTGNTPSELIVLNKNLSVEDICIDMREATNGLFTTSTGIRMKKGNLVFTAKGCTFQYVEKAFVRIDAAGGTVDMEDCVIRNSGNVAGVNEGRVIDTRGMNQAKISIKNCYVYNLQGDLVRDGNAASIDSLILKNNTFSNVGTRISFVKPKVMLIEDNIFADFGWKNEARAGINNFLAASGDSICVKSFFVLMGVLDADLQNVVNISIKNNNVYENDGVTALFSKFPKSGHISGLDANGEKLQAAGKLTYSGNIEEKLTFDNGCPVEYKWMEVYFGNPGMEKHPDLYDGLSMFYEGKYTYNYPASAKSATASTTGGKIGAQL